MLQNISSRQCTYRASEAETAFNGCQTRKRVSNHASDTRTIRAGSEIHDIAMALDPCVNIKHCSLDIKDILIHQMGNVGVSKLVDAKEEYTKYMQNRQISDNILESWKKNESNFPRLAVLSRNYLAIPASSVPSEQAFSAAVQVITDRRNRLGNRTIQDFNVPTILILFDS